MRKRLGARVLRRVVPIVTGAALAAAALCGCAPTVPQISRPTPSALATAPTPGRLPATALFRITATATAPNGAVADLVETVFAPGAPTARDLALLNAQCNYPGVPSLKGQPTWQSRYPSPLFVTTTITSTIRAGSPAWSRDDKVIFYFLGTAAYSGAFSGFESYCAPGILGVPGTIHGVAPVPASDPVGGSFGWANRFGSYGFNAGGNYPVTPVVGGAAVVSSCAIHLSAAARAASPVANAWATQLFVPADGCRFSDPSPS